jgi:hypothetical protein
MSELFVNAVPRKCAIVSLLVVTFLVSSAVAQQKHATKTDLLGAWTLLSVDNVKPDGSRVPRHGAHPAGLLIFDAQGRYSMIVLTEGTPEEYKAAIEGNNSDYGRFTVQEADQSITFYMDHASHPELEGSSHTRYFTLKGDRLSYATVKLPADGKARDTYGEAIFERAK